MATPTTLPVAQLRALGCRVSTIIGHDPDIGDFKYSIRVPDSIDLSNIDYASEGLRGELRRSSIGHADIRVPRRSDGHHLTVKACAYRIGIKTPDDVAKDYHRDAGAALSRVYYLIRTLLTIQEV